MTNHPMEPSPELARTLLNTPEEERIAAAYRAGADAELEACIEYIAGPGRWFMTPQFRLAELRAARRPKPPSLKEQALKILNARFDALPPIDAGTIRRALEQLDD